MSDTVKPKSKYAMFRASIIYTGKQAGKTGCAFVKAKTHEDASKFIIDTLKASMKKSGMPENCFDVKVLPSSQEEVDFYLNNKADRNYTGVIN